VVVGSLYNLALNQIYWSGVVECILTACILQVVIGTFFMLYRGRCRTASFEESSGPGLTMFSLAGLLAVIFAGMADARAFPGATAVLGPPVALLIVAAGRWAHRAWTERGRNPSGAEKVLIYGAGSASTGSWRLICSENPALYQVVGVIDGVRSTRDLLLLGVPLLGNRQRLAPSHPSRSRRNAGSAAARNGAGFSGGHFARQQRPRPNCLRARATH
jgi:dTDP-glucose 4,6-dehydratase